MSCRTSADLTRPLGDPDGTTILLESGHSSIINQEGLGRAWVLYGPKWSITVDNGPELSPGALGRVSGGPERGSLEVSRGCMGSPGTVLRGLVRVMCARRGFMGSPKLEILSFLQPLWCDLHVFQGPTWDRPLNWN